MGVILGTMTQVIVDTVSEGFQSVSWNMNTQPNRMWQLGEWLPWKTQLSATVSVNITAYATAISQILLEPAESCEPSTAVKTITINAQACAAGSSVNEVLENMFITSYSYSKGDPIGYGTESWAFQGWLQTELVGDEWINTPIPTTVLQGITEGTRSGDDFERGVEFATGTVVEGREGSVSAGVTVGNADVIEMGIVVRIGGGLLEAMGLMGQSSASIPHTPLYIQV